MTNLSDNSQIEQHNLQNSSSKFVVNVKESNKLNNNSRTQSNATAVYFNRDNTSLKTNTKIGTSDPDQVLNKNYSNINSLKDSSSKNQYHISQDLYNQKVVQNSSINMNMFKNKVKKQVVTSNTNNGFNNNLYGNYKKVLGPSNLSVTNIIGEKRFDEINNYVHSNSKTILKNNGSNNNSKVVVNNTRSFGKNT